VLGQLVSIIRARTIVNANAAPDSGKALAYATPISLQKPMKNTDQIRQEESGNRTSFAVFDKACQFCLEPGVRIAQLIMEREYAFFPERELYFLRSRL
jgi:hypothetical protein